MRKSLLFLKAAGKPYRKKGFFRESDRSWIIMKCSFPITSRRRKKEDEIRKRGKSRSRSLRRNWSRQRRKTQKSAGKRTIWQAEAGRLSSRCVKRQNGFCIWTRFGMPLHRRETHIGEPADSAGTTENALLGLASLIQENERQQRETEKEIGLRKQAEERKAASEKRLSGCRERLQELLSSLEVQKAKRQKRNGNRYAVLCEGTCPGRMRFRWQLRNRRSSRRSG